MSELTEKLIEQALELPPDQRARLAERVFPIMEVSLAAARILHKTHYRTNTQEHQA